MGCARGLCERFAKGVRGIAQGPKAEIAVETQLV